MLPGKPSLPSWTRYRRTDSVTARSRLSVRAKLACTMAHLMGFRVCMIGQDRRFVLPDDAIKNGPGSMADVSFVQIGPETGKDLMKHHRGAMAILCACHQMQ